MLRSFCIEILVAAFFDWLLISVVSFNCSLRKGKGSLLAEFSHKLLEVYFSKFYWYVLSARFNAFASLSVVAC